MTAKRSVWLLTSAVCLIYAINGGIRGNFGVLLQPIADSSGLGYADVSFVLAISQLVFGLLQPVFGVVAIRRSERFVMCAGVMLMCAGFLLTPFCRGFWPLMFALGLLLPAGTAALSFGLLLGVVSMQIPKEKGPVVSGLINASSGVGTTVLAPLLQSLTAVFGLLGTMFFLGVPSLLLLPVSVWLCRFSPKIAGGKERAAKKNFSVSKMLRVALKDRNYLFLIGGFFTCGFHMAILETHFFTQLTTFGLDRATAAIAFSVYGILTVIGSALSGWFCARFPMRIILGGIYAVRVLLAVTIIFMPKTLAAIFLFVVFLGLTSDSTVSPTSGLVLELYGAEKLATLFGIAFLTHQVGCFFSAWLGGIVAEATGGFVALWTADAVLAAVAAAMSFAVAEKLAR